MTAAFSRTAFAGPSKGPTLPTLPEGWPIGSYNSYAEAQRAVDHLADNAFPVEDVTIVGVEPMLVERVKGRLTWAKVLTGGAASGAWFGLFVGLLLSLFTPDGGLLPIVIGLVAGVGFGLASSAMGYAATRGRRDFVSHSQLVASRYDVLSMPRNAEHGREMLARLSMSSAAVN
ncbi:general stress protein [Amycolatopsis palatopharyngis]|uniref:general stress protein n=1 Tax=Amycolatopsis palatopharyngis TaxID=187982 RepID=UPI000E283481|nr:general stress protein [Amycolatopsis palatopharyngis]